MVKKYFFLAVVILLISSCSINKLVVDVLTDTLTGGEEESSVFTKDDDPQLVGDALPFILKLYEALLEENPQNIKLLLTTGSGFIMYANTFVHSEAEMLPPEEYERKEALTKRAKKLYLRGRDYLLKALEIKYPGFKRSLSENNFDQALNPVKKEDVPLLYWCAAGWFGAIAIDVFDLRLTIDLKKAEVIMERAYQLDPDFNNGAIHEFYIMYYSSLPEGMGGDKEKARYHFGKAVELTEGMSASPYIALATTLCIKNQDVEEFKELLNRALEIDPDANPENRLINIINQRKARWYLKHIEDFFLIE